MKLVEALRVIAEIFNNSIYITKVKDAIVYAGTVVVTIFNTDVAPAASTGALALSSGFGKVYIQVNAITDIEIEGSLTGTDWFPIEVYRINNTATKLTGTITTAVGDIFKSDMKPYLLRVNNTGATLVQVCIDLTTE